ncbi:MAG: hypothetical protein KR126chlam4_00104 [Candidatus Anoxychlamydiales bacterium]|nr:hypothetical protein [Candidatus Anoxychlamydiales bacterium]NGX40287.1 hypothetical protein [Candidatus Anoxychlamydiales bacterium]
MTTSLTKISTSSKIINIVTWPIQKKGNLFRTSIPIITIVASKMLANTSHLHSLLIAGVIIWASTEFIFHRISKSKKIDSADDMDSQLEEFDKTRDKEKHPTSSSPVSEDLSGSKLTAKIDSADDMDSQLEESEDLSGSKLTAPEVELIKGILNDPNWKTKIDTKLQDCFSKLHIEEKDIRQIWGEFPTDLKKRLNGLSQKIDIKYQKFFLSTEILTDYASVIIKTISSSAFSNSRDKRTTNKIFKAFQTFNIPTDIIEIAWSSYSKDKNINPRLLKLFKKVSKEDREYFKSPGMFSALDTAAFLRKALANPKYWQDKIDPNDLEQITQAFQKFHLDYYDFKKAWITEKGKETLATMLDETLQSRYIECFTE